MLAVIRVEQHDPRCVGAAFPLFAQQRSRAIAAAVVDEDDLVARIQRVERRVQPGEQRRQTGLLVEDWNDDRELRLVHDSLRFRSGWRAHQLRA